MSSDIAVGHRRIKVIAVAGPEKRLIKYVGDQRCRIRGQIDQHIQPHSVTHPSHIDSTNNFRLATVTDGRGKAVSLQVEFHAELTRLRQRRGLAGKSLGRVVGPRLHALCGTSPTDADRVVQKQVEQCLRSLAQDLPPDLLRVVELVFALDRNHYLPDLRDRQEQLCQEQRFALSTARRRMEEVTHALAAAAESAWAARGGKRVDSGWRVRSLQALLRLDTPTPELYETRTIVATTALDEIVVRLDLPRPDSDRSDGGDLFIDVLYGARISSVKTGNGKRHYEIRLALPETLSPGHDHELCVHFRVAPEQRIRNRYVIIPLDPCDYGIIRARFASGRKPTALWRLDSLPHGLLDDPDRHHEPLRLDGVGEVMAKFEMLREGRGYGIGWRFAEP